MPTLYEKRGRRYYPVAEQQVFDSIPGGHWLVSVYPGVRTQRRILEPSIAEAEAAIEQAAEAMVAAMNEANRPTFDLRRTVAGGYRAVTPEETERYKRAYKAWSDIVGDQPLCFNGVSMYDVVQAGIDVLRKRMIAESMQKEQGHGAQKAE